MTSILDQLADAMSAAADTVREDEVRPLVTPERRRRGPAGGRWRGPAGARWRPPGWAAPAAAAAAVVLVVCLAATLSDGLSGVLGPARPGHRPGGPASSTPAAPHPFYLATDLSISKIVVRSTATGKVVAAVPVPSLTAGPSLAPALAVAANGTFYVAAFSSGITGEQIYGFRLTTAGHVTGFAKVPGGSLRSGWGADALAASPDGSVVAVGAYYWRGFAGRNDQLLVIHTATGTQSTWQSGSTARAYRYFSVASLSWTADGRELAVLAEWCRVQSGPGGENCPSGERQAELRAIDPAGQAGSLMAGHLLLAQSSRFPYLAQALISPDGSVITAMVLRGRTVGNPQISGMFPQNLAVEEISVPGNHLLSVLYRRNLGDTSQVSGPMADPLALSADASGGNLILNGGICNASCSNEFNGWLRAGRLISLRPSGFAYREAAEAW